MAAVIGKFCIAPVDSILAPNVVCGGATMQPGTVVAVAGLQMAGLWTSC